MALKHSLPRLAVCALLTFNSHVASTAVGSVFTNIPEAAAEGYTVIFELNIPVNGGFRDSTPVPYTTNNSATAPDFDRVAYYLELTGAGGTDWVYVSMEAFTDDAQKLGLPHNVNNPVLHQRNVRNMNVASNVAGVVTGSFIDAGHIEMWPSNYSTGDSHGVFAASGSSFDWGDGGATTSSGYGSFQVHNPVARQTVFAYNRWGVNDAPNDDIGIGNRPTGHPDWTGAANAATYSARKLAILVRPRTYDATFTDLPRDRQLYSRNVATNLATVPIAGQESFGGYQRIFLRVFRNGILHFQTDHTLSYQGGNASFSFNPQIVAELANYDFELLLEKSGQLKTVERVNDVVAGDAYFFYGQSNAESWSWDTNRSANEYASEWLRTFGQNGDNGTHAQNILHWVEAEGDGDRHGPGSIGQWAMVLGRQLIDTYGIPIAILNGSRSSYGIRRLQKDRDDPDNLHDTSEVRRPYNRLRYRAIQAGVATTARAMFFYQGEGDNENASRHANGFADLREDWADDYPGIERFYTTQVRPGCGVTASNLALRQVQRRFADVYPNTSVMASNGLLNHDGCHYLFTSGYEDLGFHHFRKVARDLYGAPNGPDIDALNPASVAFTNENRTEIRLILRNPATIHFPLGALSDFNLAGTSATIAGRTIAGNSILFQLSGPAAATSVLEYRAHLGAGEWVTNDNGVGMLSFVEPVEEFEPGGGFAAWAEALPAGQRGETDDPGGYGIVNILRYAFDMEPVQPDPNQLPQVGLATISVEGQPQKRLSLTYTRRIDDVTLTYAAEASENLVLWTSFPATAQFTDHGNGKTETVTLTATEALSGTERRFLRVRVE